MKSINEIQAIQDSLDSQGIIFCYSGYLTEDIMLSMGTALRQKMAMVKADKSDARAIFAIFVEEAQNVIRYSSGILSHSDAEEEDELRRGFLAIGKENGNYFVSCGNLVLQMDVDRLQGHLSEIQSMGDDELKKLYKKVLKGDPPEGSKGAGIGFIDIARKAKKGFEFGFKSVDAGHSYFLLKAFI